MNASPAFTTPPAVMWILIPALICLFGIVIGIVTAFRHGDARVPLGIGGLAFVALLFSLGFVSTTGRVQSSPIALEHSVSSPMQPLPVINTQFVVIPLIALALIVGLIVAAIRRGHWKAVAAFSVCTLVAAITLPAIQQYREAERRTQTVDHLKQLGLQLHASHDTATTPFTAVASAPSGPTPSQILYTTGNAQPISIQELPGWRKNPPHEGVLGAGRAKYVLTSQQFATVDEAEAELFQSLTADVQESFTKYHSPAVGWHPTPEDLRLSGIIAERVVETFSVKVGEFENPVHRVSWLIEFDHDKSTVLLKRWEPLEAQRRAKLILSILAGASGVLGVTAMALRRRRHLPTPEANPANQLT